MSIFLNEIEKRVLVYDGSKGYMLQKLGLKGGECPELWNVTHRAEVKEVYSLYKAAGSDVIQTNTFQGSRVQLEKYGLGDRTYELNYEGARLAREVMGKDGFVAASVGPIGKLFEPLGDLTFAAAYDIFKEQIKAVTDGGVDIINFETFTDIGELRAALLAAKALGSLPVICSVSFESNGKTLMGTDPQTAAVILKSLGADMIGTNCSMGPEHMVDITDKMSRAGGGYLSVKPNAGLPEMIDGKVVYKETAGRFAQISTEFVRHGARLIGGCCGTTPDFITAIRNAVKGVEVPELTGGCEKIITSGVRLVSVEEPDSLNLGYLNAGTDRELSNRLMEGNFDYIAERAMDLSAEEHDVIYISMSEMESEKDLLGTVVDIVQGYVKAPFIIEARDPQALENALRLYRGKAGVMIRNSGNQAEKDLLAVAQKYGSTVVDFDSL